MVHQGVFPPAEVLCAVETFWQRTLFVFRQTRRPYTNYWRVQNAKLYLSRTHRRTTWIPQSVHQSGATHRPEKSNSKDAAASKRKCTQRSHAHGGRGHFLLAHHLPQLHFYIHNIVINIGFNGGGSPFFQPLCIVLSFCLFVCRCVGG